MPRGHLDRVNDIRSAIADIRSDTVGMTFKTFEANPVVVRAVLYSIGVIGEAVKSLDPELKAAHPHIPWRAIAGIRDRIVHEYFRMNARRIWDVVQEDLDSLEQALRAISGNAESS